MGTDLTQSPIGRVTPIVGVDQRFGTSFELDAYVPDSLPLKLELASDTWIAVSEAMAALGRLDAAARMVPNPRLIARVATRREAIGTSALEGTFANLSDLFAAEAASVAEDGPRVPANIHEVLNYTRAADAAYEWIEERPITQTLLSNLQALIVQGTESDGPDAGNLRTTQVFVGTRNRPIAEARYVPPPPGDQLVALVGEWLAWINEDLGEALNLVVRVALAHYQFEAIHPYTDGNGRLGRLVAVVQILKDGTLSSPVLSISDWLKERGEEYRDHLLEVSKTGEWDPWVTFFANAISASATDTHRRVTDLLQLREELVKTTRAALPRARLAVDIAEDLIAFPILTVSAAQSRYGKSNQANRDAIHRLCDIGVLTPFSNDRYDRLYWNQRVLETIEHATF